MIVKSAVKGKGSLNMLTGLALVSPPSVPWRPRLRACRAAVRKRLEDHPWATTIPLEQE